MKIALVTSLDFGTHSGAHTRAIKIYSLLAEKHDVILLNVNTVNKSSLPEDIAGRDLGIRPDYLPHTARELITGYRALRTAEAYDFDLVWGYNSFQHTPLISWSIANHLDIPLIVGINDHRHGHGIKGTLVNEYGRRFVLNRANVLIFESDTLWRNLDDYGISPNQSLVIPTGIDLTEYYLPEIPLNESPVVFYVGRDKDIDLLLEAARIAHNSVPDLTVKLAGVNADTYPEYADENYVEFLGFVTESELRREMGRSHVCTVPYRNAETAGRPVKILEYMSAKKCIVATDLPFNTQMLVDDENAVITDANSESFAEGLLYALQNPNERNRLAAQAHEDVKEYSLDRMSERLTEAINLVSCE